ncbi:glycosyltransferase family 2 protein [Erythrobacter ani]|uniref:Glycosyltransferase family 2 protein n=1 Tax=Erythrobacter ani TaxID=2827235 RepID=A0ABS6SKP9_9SPHN|nr:glycosyltransferase family A protein [Erythrobacter ani]MBV7265561.1 glycosyltransferase family 2 protein [Erythrobacter ani]
MGREKNVGEVSAATIGDFDPEWYRSQYPDVDMLRMDPADHFERYGARLGRLGKPGGSHQKHAAAAKPWNKLPVGGEGGDPIDIRDFCKKEWARYRRRKEVLNLLTRPDLPKVTVVMTSHNAEDTVEAAVQSMLMQSYPNLEVVICDDASTDRTWSVLQALEVQTGSAVRAIRLARNSGTYLAKNIAIKEAKGDFILFQDSDDYSHAHRVACQIEPLIDDETLIATRTKYARFNPDNFSVIAREGDFAKLGLITLCVRRRVFDEIGFFDAVRKAGDDEWFRRLRHLCGSHSVQDLPVSLYNAELRPNSLIADMVTVRADGSIGQSSSKSRRAYVSIFSKRLEENGSKPDWYRSNFPPVPNKAQQAYPPEIAAITPSRAPVIGAVCSIPSRIGAFEKVIERLLPQVDELHVYLDKYARIPDFLSSKKVEIYRSENYDIDFRDNAKFLMFDQCKKRFPEGFYYFTFDDDIVYPHDYVRHLIAGIDEFDRSAVVGVHGVLLVENPQKYSRQRVVFHFSADDLANPVLVNNLGTGTVGFWSGAFDKIAPEAWGAGGMVDIEFSVLARQMGVPMVCIQRHAGWLASGELAEDDVPLFRENKKKEGVIRDKLAAAKPWGYEGIEKSLQKLNNSTAEKLEKLLPRFRDELYVSRFFQRMRRK